MKISPPNLYLLKIHTQSNFTVKYKIDNNNKC